MSVHGTPTGSWRVRWQEIVKGKTYHRSRTFPTRTEAEAHDAQMKRERQLESGRKALGLDPFMFGSEFVYVVQAADKVKIGVSNNPYKRLQFFRTGSVVPVEMVWVIESADGRRLEAILHDRFDRFRTHGEWFEAEPVLDELDFLWRVGVSRLNDCRNVAHENAC